MKRSKPLKRTAMRKVSKKGASRMAMYRKAKKEYLSAHWLCEVCVWNLALEIHHRKGRLSSLLWDQSFFLACCPACHRRIETEREWAMKNGYSLDRLKV